MYKRQIDLHGQATKDVATTSKSEDTMDDIPGGEPIYDPDNVQVIRTVPQNTITISNDSKSWLVIDNLQLSLLDKVKIETGGALSKKVVDACQSMIRTEFPFYGGLMKSFLMANRSHIPATMSDIIQILRNDEEYVLLALIEGNLTVFHFNNLVVTRELKEQIVKAFHCCLLYTSPSPRD